MYMDIKKIYAQNVNEQETLIQKIRICNQDIETKFGTENCAILIVEISCRETMEEIEVLNKEGIRTLEGKGQVLENIESEHHQMRRYRRKTWEKWTLEEQGLEKYT